MYIINRNHKNHRRPAIQNSRHVHVTSAVLKKPRIFRCSLWQAAIRSTGSASLPRASSDTRRDWPKGYARGSKYPIFKDSGPKHH